MVACGPSTARVPPGFSGSAPLGFESSTKLCAAASASAATCAGELRSSIVYLVYGLPESDHREKSASLFQDIQLCLSRACLGKRLLLRSKLKLNMRFLERTRIEDSELHLCGQCAPQRTINRRHGHSPGGDRLCQPTLGQILPFSICNVVACPHRACGRFQPRDKKTRRALTYHESFACMPVLSLSGQKRGMFGCEI